MRAIALSMLVGLSMLTPLANSTAATPPLRVQAVCFDAVGPNGTAVRLFGRRYAAGVLSSNTPAVVLVHGIDSSADTWDLTPTTSPARMLARVGYVVFTYDRLGFKRSTYRGSPADLTLPAQQLVLHQLVTDVHRGRFALSTATSCRSAPRATRQIAARRVVLVGHSSGGFMVAGYPGRFHDVSAIVVANAPSGLLSLDPPGDAAALSLLSSQTAAPAAHYVPIGSARHDGPAPRPSSGYTDPLPTRSACEQFMLWRSGAIPAVATVLCNPANATLTPKAETQSYPAQMLLNLVFIPRTGATPVLLADADHDTMMPGKANALEISAWRQNCRCPVSQFVLHDTGHSFMSHQSIGSWIRDVTAWLRSHDLGA